MFKELLAYFGYVHLDVVVDAERELDSVRRKLIASEAESERIAKERATLVTSHATNAFISDAVVAPYGGTDTKPNNIQLVVSVVKGGKRKDIVVKRLAHNNKNKAELTELAAKLLHKA